MTGVHARRFAMEDSTCVGLFDLPKSFLAQVLSLCDSDTKHRLICVSKSAFDACMELSPGALVCWGSPASARLELLLHMGGLRALLLPDSSHDQEVPSDVCMAGLNTLVLNYRLPRLIHSLTTAAHATNISSMIVRGWRLGSTFLHDLSNFLQQLQHIHTLQTLVLTLPCPGPAAAALGKLTQLHSLNVCYEISRNSEGIVGASGLNFTQDCWQAGVQPLRALTSLVMRLPLVLQQGESLGLEHLPELRRLELQLERPVPPANSQGQSPPSTSSGLRTANAFLCQQLPALQHLTRLVLNTPYTVHISEVWDVYDDPERQPPADAIEIIAQLSSLRSLHLTPHRWLLGLRQLQPLSACRQLTELVLSELAMGFTADARRLDDNGSQLSAEEQAVVKAAVAASAAMHAEQQQQQLQQGQGPLSISSTPEPVLLASPGFAAAAAAAAGQSPVSSDSTPASGIRSPATAGHSSTAAAAAAAGDGGGGGGSAGDAVPLVVDGLQVCAPLLPGLRVLHVSSLWWRLPLCVLSGVLEDVAYKRLSDIGRGSYVMSDLQQIEFLDNMAFPAPGELAENLMVGLAEGLMEPGAPWWNNLPNNDAAAGAGAGAGAGQNPWGPPLFVGGIQQQQQQLLQPPPGADPVDGAMDGVIVDGPEGMVDQLQQLELHADGQAHGQQQQQQQPVVQEQLPLQVQVLQLQQLLQALQQQIQALQQNVVQHGPEPGAAAGLAAVAAHIHEAQHIIQQDIQLQPPPAAGDVGAAAAAAGGDQNMQAQMQVQLPPLLPAVPEGDEVMSDGDMEQQDGMEEEEQEEDGEEAAAEEMWWGGAAEEGAHEAAVAAAGGPAAQQEGDLGPPNAGAGGGWWGANQVAGFLMGNGPGQGAAGQAAAAAGGAQPLADAPAGRIYADVLRGMRGLRALDIDVTGLCKVMRLTSLPLADVCELRLHMLGSVLLPPGGLPCLPSLTYLEFYLPGDRNWEAEYNAEEDVVLWQHQVNVRHLVIRGTFHAGGFFAPGHLDRAHAAMPHITRLVFNRCRDFKPQLLQQVVDSRLSTYIEVVHGTNFEHPSEPSIEEGQPMQQHTGAAAAMADGAGSSSNMDVSMSGTGGSTGVAQAAAAVAGSEGGAAPNTVLDEAPATLPPDLVTGSETTGSEGSPLLEAHHWDPDAPVPDVFVHNLMSNMELPSAEASWQAKRHRAAQAAQARKQELDRVVAGAARVDVEVKLLPAVAWQSWFTQLLE